MPTYEGECGLCRAVSEHSLRMSDAPRAGDVMHVPCPRCHAPQLTRILSVPTLADAAIAAGLKYPYESVRFHAKQLPGCKVSANGHPIVRSETHERELMRRHNLARE